MPAALATRVSAEAPARQARRPATRRGDERVFEPGRVTLDQRVSAAWERLVAEGGSDCLVCGSETPAGRECPGCGSELD